MRTFAQYSLATLAVCGILFVMALMGGIEGKF